MPFVSELRFMFVKVGQKRYFREFSYGLELTRLNHVEGVYIINAKHCISPTRSVVYHQAAGRCTLKRDEIQPRRG